MDVINAVCCCCKYMTNYSNIVNRSLFCNIRMEKIIIYNALDPYLLKGALLNKVVPLFINKFLILWSKLLFYLLPFAFAYITNNSSVPRFYV